MASWQAPAAPATRAAPHLKGGGKGGQAGQRDGRGVAGQADDIQPLRQQPPAERHLQRQAAAAAGGGSVACWSGQGRWISSSSSSRGSTPSIAAAITDAPTRHGSAAQHAGGAAEHGAAAAGEGAAPPHGQHDASREQRQGCKLAGTGVSALHQHGQGAGDDRDGGPVGGWVLEGSGEARRHGWWGRQL